MCLLYGITSDQILDYFRSVLGVLNHHRATLKLNIFKWFQGRCEFVDMDMSAYGAHPAQSKNEAFDHMEQPNTWGDLRMLIVISGYKDSYCHFMIFISDPGGTSCQSSLN